MKIMKKKYVTLFPAYKDFHFYKDPGQIPYRFQKKGYVSEIVCYDNDKDYPETRRYLSVNVIPMNKLNKKYNLGMILYLIMNSKRIDILNLFHLTFHSLFYAFIYKLINPSGFVYLKMDNCHHSGDYPWEKIFTSEKKSANIISQDVSKKEKRNNDLMKKYFVHKVDLWSVEDESSCEYYKKQYPFFKDRLITSLNGHTVDLHKSIKIKSFSKKENIIISVGRLGTFQKATEILLQSFQMISKDCAWNLHLAGDIAPEFKGYVDNYFVKYPELKERVVFHGSLGKDKLFELYNRSKIFCLPSRFETFANVFSEAMYFSNAIITTYNVSPRDFIKNRKMGILIERNNCHALAEAMMHFIENESLNRTYAENARTFAEEELGWDKITDELHATITINSIRIGSVIK